MQPRPKSRRWFWLVLLACFGVVAVFRLRHLDEPMHKGRPVRVWVEQCFSLRPPGDIARKELPKIGTPAVPLLRANLKLKDSWLRKRWYKSMSGQPAWLRNWLPEGLPVQDIRFITHGLLSQLGTNAVAAVPDLIWIVERKRDPVLFAVENLGNIGPAASNALPVLRAFVFTNSFEQANLAAAIWKIDNDTKAALNRLLPLLTNQLDFTAATVLGYMGPAAAPAAPALADIVASSTKPMGLRMNSANSLGRIGVNDGSVREAYLLGMKASNTWLEVSCALGLWRIDETFGPKALSLHLEIIEESKGTPDHKNRILYLLRDYKMAPEQAIPILRSLVESGSGKQRRHAIEALQMLTNQPPSRLPTQ